MSNLLLHSVCLTGEETDIMSNDAFKLFINGFIPFNESLLSPHEALLSMASELEKAGRLYDNTHDVIVLLQSVGTQYYGYNITKRYPVVIENFKLFLPLPYTVYIPDEVFLSNHGFTLDIASAKYPCRDNEWVEMEERVPVCDNEIYLSAVALINRCRKTDYHVEELSAKLELHLDNYEAISDIKILAENELEIIQKLFHRILERLEETV